MCLSTHLLSHFVFFLRSKWLKNDQIRRIDFLKKREKNRTHVLLSLSVFFSEREKSPFLFAFFCWHCLKFNNVDGIRGQWTINESLSDTYFYFVKFFKYLWWFSKWDLPWTHLWQRFSSLHTFSSFVVKGSLFFLKYLSQKSSLALMKLI